MDIFIVAEAYNRKNGANGSLIDLHDILFSLNRKSVFITSKRNLLFGIIEALKCGVNLIIALKFIRSQRYLFNGKSQSPIIFSTNLDLVFFSRLRKYHPNSTIILFQTGNLPAADDFNNIFFKRLKFADYLFFESPKLFYDFSTKFCNLSVKPFLTYATTSIENCFLNENQIISNNQVLIYCAGSIQPRKNQVFLIKAFIEGINSGLLSNCKLLLSGPLLHAAYPDYIKEFLSLIQSNPHIIFLGNRVDYHKIMLKSDIVISVSIEEGLSTIIREAMFMKKCIIATNIDGHSGVLKNNENALIFELGQNSIQLIQLMRRAILSNFLREVLGNKAQEFYFDKLSFHSYRKRIDTFLIELNAT